MDDKELEALRAKRLAEIQNQYKGRDGGNEKIEEEKRKAEEMKNALLTTILDQNARARLNTLKLAKPDKGAMVERMLMQMAQNGQIGDKLTENELIGILERVSERTQKTTTVKYDRRRILDDMEDDDLDL